MINISFAFSHFKKCFYFYKNNLTSTKASNKQTVVEQSIPAVLLNKVNLPVSIKNVDRLIYDQTQDKLLMVEENQDGTYGVTSYDGEEFKQLLKITGKFFEGHIFLDSQDNIYFFGNMPSRLYRTVDHGQTWKIVLDGEEMFWGFTDAGQGILYATLWSDNRPIIYQSLDQGKTWQIWQNFSTLFPEYAVKFNNVDTHNKMRHLHDIVAVNNDIYVGTGDVARFSFVSKDGGKNWNKIWGEGFTAHLLDKKNQILFLAADDSTGQGIARVDLQTGVVQDVWRPDNSGWYGYIYSLIQQNGIYYAGVHIENNNDKKLIGYGVLSSIDGKNWQKFVEIKSRADYSKVYLANGEDGKVYLSLDNSLYWFKGL